MNAAFGIELDLPAAAGQDFDRLAALWRSLRGVLQAIDHTIRAASGDPALTLAHWQVLLGLGRRSPLMQNELRQHTGLDSGFLTRLLDELDARQLLERTRDHADRRQVQLNITPAGRAALRSMLTAAGGSGLLARRPQIERLQRLAASLLAEVPGASKTAAAIQAQTT